MFKNYFKIAFRNIIRHRIFSIINIIGLAVGISLCLLIIMLYLDHKSMDQFNVNKGRIYRVIADRTVVNSGTTSYATAPLPLAELLLKESPAVEQVVRMRGGFGGEAKAAEKVLPVNGFFVDAEFFRLFNFELEQGDPAQALLKPNSVVLTRKTAVKFFGNEDPIGRTLSFDKTGDFIVTGVFDDTEYRTHLQFEMLASISSLNSLEKEKKTYPALENWEDFYASYVYFMTKKNASTEQVAALLSDISQRQYADNQKLKVDFFLQRLTGISMSKILYQQPGGVLPHLFFYFVGVFGLIVLITACFNYTSLTIARSLTRAREVGVRKVCGAAPRQIFAQFISEAVLISLISLLFAYGLLEFLKPAFFNIHGYLRELFQLKMSFMILSVFISFSILVGIIAGFFPALFIAALNPVRVLKSTFSLKMFSHLTLRKTLIVIQFALSLIFIITARLMFNEAELVLNGDYGFNKQHLLNVELKGVQPQILAEEISRNNHIQGVSASTLIDGIGMSINTFLKKPTAPDSIQFTTNYIDHFYIDNLELKLIAGKNFEPSFAVAAGKERYIIFNETAVRQMGFAQPIEAIGQPFQIEGQQVELIGVVEDYHHINFEGAIKPLVLRYVPSEFRYLNVRISPNDVQETLVFLEATWRKIDPVHAFSYKFHTAQVEEYVSFINIYVTIIGSIAFLTIFIACLGLLGMTIFATETRIKEIGIRKVLGAGTVRIVFLLSRDFLKLLIIAVVIAAPISYLLNNLWLQNFTYRVDIGVGVFSFGISLLFALGLIIVGSQAITKALANPVEALRYE